MAESVSMGETTVPPRAGTIGALGAPGRGCAAAWKEKMESVFIIMPL